MKLGEILDSLVSSELANLGFVQEGEIVQDKIPKIVNAINLGLVKLYTRFKLKRGYLLLEVSSALNVYELTHSNAVSSGNLTGYILDTDAPYLGDLLEIIEIVSPSGDSIRFDGSQGLTLLKPNTIKFIGTPTEGLYAIEYAALPNKLIYSNAVDIEVELPDVYLSALLYFIGSRFYSSVGVSMDSNRNSMDISYSQRYEAECQFLEMKGVDVGTNTDTDFFNVRGFI